MKYSLGISNFLEEISSLSHSTVFLYLFASIPGKGFLISPCYSLELCIQMGISFLFSFVFRLSSFHSYLEGLLGMWFTGKGNGKALQCSCFENPMSIMKRQKDRTLKDELPRLVVAQYATGDQWSNNSRKNEGMEPKQQQHPIWLWLVIETRSDAVKRNII